MCHQPTKPFSSRVSLEDHYHINPLLTSSLRYAYRNVNASRSFSSSDATRSSAASPSQPPPAPAVQQQTTLLDGKERLQPQPEMASSNHSSDTHTTSITRLYDYLRLETFQNDELESAFDRVVAKGGSAEESEAVASSATMNQMNLQAFVYDRILESEVHLGDGSSSTQADLSQSCVHARQQYAAREAKNLLLLLGPEPTFLSREDFVKAVRTHAGKMDNRRSLPIIASMLLVGSSVGIISPALPFIVSDLGLSPTQFGMTVSAFALAKMLSNVPSAIAVERHGRKPYMIYSLAIVAVATAGIGLAGSFEELYVCRLLTGTYPDAP